MQSLMIELSVEDGQHGGGAFNVYAGVDANGRPAVLDFASPLNGAPPPGSGAPAASLPGVGPSPGHLNSAYLAGQGSDAVYAGGGLRSRPGLGRGKPVVRYLTDERFYFGRFEVTARPVTAGGDEQDTGNVVETFVVNSAPRSPEDVKLTGYDPANDQVVIAFTPSPQFG